MKLLNTTVLASIKACTLSALLLLASTAFSLDLQEAKAQGLLGETASGYLEPVTTNAEALALSTSINSQRKAEYQRIATTNHITVTDVEALAGKKAIERTPAGQYIKVGMEWRKK